jgi:hypothetical protein
MENSQPAFFLLLCFAYMLLVATLIRASVSRKKPVKPYVKNQILIIVLTILA